MKVQTQSTFRMSDTASDEAINWITSEMEKYANFVTREAREKFNENIAVSSDWDPID